MTKKNYTILGAAAALLLIALYSVNLALLAASAIIAYKVISPLMGRIFDSVVLRIIAFLVIYMVLLQCIAIGSWILSRNFPLTLVPLLTLLFSVVSYAYARYRGNLGTSLKLPLVTKPDIISLGIAAAVSLLLVIPPLATNGFDKKSSLIGIMNGNVDDPAHLGLLNDRLQFDRGILYHSDVASNMRTAGFYPAGWHSANAVIIKALYPDIKTGAASMVFYIATKLFWFFILVYLFSRAVFLVYSRLFSEKYTPSSFAWASIGAFMFSTFFLVNTFVEGFYSFIFQLVAMLLLIPLLLQLVEDEKHEAQWHNTLLLIAIACIGGTLSWFLVLPAFALLAIALLFGRIRKQGAPRFFKELWANIQDNFLLYGLIIGATLVQVYVMLVDKSGGSVSFLQGILLNGGISIFREQFYYFIFIGFVLCLLFLNKKREREMQFILYAILPVLLFCGFMYVIQFMAIGKSAYYYYKVLNIFTVIMIPLAIAGFAAAISSLEKYRSNLTAALSCSLLVLLVLQFIGFDAIKNPSAVSLSNYLSGQRFLSGVLDESLYRKLTADTTQSDYYDKKYTFYFEPGKVDQNEISTMLLKSNKPDGICFNAARLAFLAGAGNFDRPVEAIKENCSTNKVDVVTDKEHKKKFGAIVKKAGIEDRLTVYSYEDTFNLVNR